MTTDDTDPVAQGWMEHGEAKRKPTLSEIVAGQVARAEPSPLEEITRERDELVELLAAIRDWLDGQQDADYEPGVSGPHPNRAMQFCTQIDELIGEYT